MTKLKNIGIETKETIQPKVDWLKHRIQPFFLLKMPDKYEDETIITEPLLQDYAEMTLEEIDNA
jgi:hypothetical protein